MSDGALDRALGLVPSGSAGRIDYKALLAHRGALRQVGDTSYDVIRDVFSSSAVTAANHFVDLGSGIGRILIYGAIVCRAKATGIELLQARVDAVRAIATQHGLNQIKCKTGDASVIGWPADADCFIVMNSLEASAARAAFLRMRQYARRQPIVVVTFSSLSRLACRNDWLSAQSLGLRSAASRAFDLQIWRSILPTNLLTN
jgi:precorrin-6B methylase 2